MPTMYKHTNWTIAAFVSWVLFMVVLFGGVVKKTAFVKEFGCTVEDFSVDPRFECFKRCHITDNEKNINHVNNVNHINDVTDVLDADDIYEIIAKVQRESPSKLSSEKEIAAYIATLDTITKKVKSKHANKDNKEKEQDPECDELEKDTLDWYSPRLCLNSKFGFEDPLCPPDEATCYTGNKWRRKCALSCPLAYNVTLDLNVDHIGHVTKSRDLGTDKDRYNSYKDEYRKGVSLTCQVVKKPGQNDDDVDEHDVLFIDERMSSEKVAWWKWSLFTITLLMALGCTVSALGSYVRFRESYGAEYAPLNPGAGNVGGSA
jgi:hypothetical protein